MANRLLILAALVMLVAALPAAAQDSDFPRTVIDMSGTAVTLPARPGIIAVTANDQVPVGLFSADELRRVELSAVTWNSVDLLVITEGHAAAFPALLEAAAAARVPVYRTTEITALDVWRSMVIGLGQATGREDRAARLITRLDRRLAVIHARVKNKAQPRVLVLTPEGYTFGEGTLITSLIEAAGGISAAAESGYGDYRQINDVAIHALAPDVILLSPAWMNTAAFAAHGVYQGLPAVQRGRVFLLPFSPSHPADPAAAALVLAILLHPGVVLPWG